jgi:cytochrome c peroxidase
VEDLSPREDAFDWRLPPGFPRPAVPADNPMTAAKVELGRRLFYDTRLSVDGTFACASCHRQELAFTDGRPQAIGATGEAHARNAMSLANVAYAPALNWANPEIGTLERQALDPMLNEDPIELGLRGHEERVLAELRWDADYRRRFAESFAGERVPIRLDNVVKAIASFERTLISGRSPYDRLVYGGDLDALSSSAKRGMRLFFSERLGCGECHGGLNFSGAVRFDELPAVEPEFHNNGLYDVDGRGAYPSSDRGLLDATGRHAHMGRFRTPTLRNIELTAPYMHDGSLPTLEAVIEHYARGGTRAPGGGASDSPHRDRLIRGFILTPGDADDLIAFLRSLTDREFVQDPRLSDPFRDSKLGYHRPSSNAVQSRKETRWRSAWTPNSSSR